MTGTDPPALGPRGFLTADWRHIAILNYAADPEPLNPLLPRGLELDLWEGRPFVSVVGLLFERLRVAGIPLLLYRRFEQVNLRIYVRRPLGTGWRPGVVFVKEFVPYRSMAAAARLLYKQHYEFAHMRHHVKEGQQFRVQPPGCASQEQRGSTSEFGVQPLGCLTEDRFTSTTVEYSWLHEKRWSRLGLKTTGPCASLTAASFEHFISERHWGYSASGPGQCLEFEVRRPPWLVSSADAWLDCDAATLYGDVFARILSSEPASAILAGGSSVALGPGTLLTSLPSQL
jgi:uncharacterized protein YqjF (DUF2071 family)